MPYNNNLIHRGFNPCFTVLRRSLHLGYRNASLPPTWYFSLLDATMFTDGYRARMSTQVREMIGAYFICRAKYPRMVDIWRFPRSA